MGEVWGTTTQWIISPAPPVGLQRNERSPLRYDRDATPVDVRAYEVFFATCRVRTLLSLIFGSGPEGQIGLSFLRQGRPT